MQQLEQELQAERTRNDRLSVRGGRGPWWPACACQGASGMPRRPGMRGGEAPRRLWRPGTRHADLAAVPAHDGVELCQPVAGTHSAGCPASWLQESVAQHTAMVAQLQRSVHEEQQRASELRVALAGERDSLTHALRVRPLEGGKREGKGGGEGGGGPAASKGLDVPWRSILPSTRLSVSAGCPGPRWPSQRLQAWCVHAFRPPASHSQTLLAHTTHCNALVQERGLQRIVTALPASVLRPPSRCRTSRTRRGRQHSSGTTASCSWRASSGS